MARRYSHPFDSSVIRINNDSIRVQGLPDRFRSRARGLSGNAPIDKMDCRYYNGGHSQALQIEIRI